MGVGCPQLACACLPPTPLTAAPGLPTSLNTHSTAPPCCLQVERLTTYADAECAVPLCMLELFSRRADRLVRRQSHPAQRTVVSVFERGATACLKRLRVVRAEEWEVELSFWSDSRPDGLMR